MRALPPPAAHQGHGAGLLPLVRLRLPPQLLGQHAVHHAARLQGGTGKAPWGLQSLPSMLSLTSLPFWLLVAAASHSLGLSPAGGKVIVQPKQGWHIVDSRCGAGGGCHPPSGLQHVQNTHRTQINTTAICGEGPSRQRTWAAPPVRCSSGNTHSRLPRSSTCSTRALNMLFHHIHMYIYAACLLYRLTAKPDAGASIEQAKVRCRFRSVNAL